MTADHKRSTGKLSAKQTCCVIENYYATPRNSRINVPCPRDLMSYPQELSVFEICAYLSLNDRNIYTSVNTQTAPELIPRMRLYQQSYVFI